MRTPPHTSPIQTGSNAIDTATAVLPRATG